MTRESSSESLPDDASIDAGRAPAAPEPLAGADAAGERAHPDEHLHDHPHEQRRAGARPPLLRSSDGFVRQAAAVPLRRRDGIVEVLLIRRRDRERVRWMIPKGLVDPGLDEPQAAAVEAWEEAGVRGRVLVPAVGSFEYEKFASMCRVTTFAMEVAEVIETWPEARQRTRGWFAAEEAVTLVHRDAVRPLVRAACVRFEAEA